jgi:hypothetical protein
MDDTFDVVIVGGGARRAPSVSGNHFTLAGFLTSDWTGQGNFLPPLPPGQSPQTLSKSPARGAFVFITQGGNDAWDYFVATRRASCGHHRSLSL